MLTCRGSPREIKGRLRPFEQMNLLSSRLHLGVNGGEKRTPAEEVTRRSLKVGNGRNGDGQAKNSRLAVRTRNRLGGGWGGFGLG